jgi:hypothetical protein
MSEQAADLVNGNSEPGPANRGWFRRGDPRINRRGRPRNGVTAAPRQQTEKKPLSGQLKRLSVPVSDLRVRLAREKGPWMVNLPNDFRIVALELDPVQQMIVLTIHSQVFQAVQEDEEIPWFSPEYHGLKWRLHR